MCSPHNSFRSFVLASIEFRSVAVFNLYLFFSFPSLVFKNKLFLMFTRTLYTLIMLSGSLNVFVFQKLYMFFFLKPKTDVSSSVQKEVQ